MNNLFFIFGYLKSGTTWLQLMLDSHPNISCQGEGHFFDMLYPHLQEKFNLYNEMQDWLSTSTFKGLKPFPKISDDDGREVVKVLIVKLMEKTADNKEVSIYGEKSPDNIRHLDQISAFFPECKFIHIVRDGRDAVVSNWLHHLRIKPDELEKFGSFENWVIEGARQWHGEMMTAVAFKRKHPERVYEVHYERLLEEPHEELRKLLDFLGADSPDDILEKAINNSSFETLTKGRKRGEEDKSSFFRKGVAGDWMEYFDMDTLESFEEIAEESLSIYGYK